MSGLCIVSESTPGLDPMNVCQRIVMRIDGMVLCCFLTVVVFTNVDHT